jgi:hypothetical protein
MFMKLGMYIMAPEPISTVYFINTSHQSMCLYVYVARQRLGENVTARTNIHATIDELLEDREFIEWHHELLKKDSSAWCS